LQETLPVDHEKAILIGRVWDPVEEGPSPVLVTAEAVHDLTPGVATVSELMAHSSPVDVARESKGKRLGDTADVLAATFEHDLQSVRFLSPIDLQCVKAAG